MTGFDAEALALLTECRVAHLATIAEDGRPRMVPVCFAAVDGRVVISHDQKPKRRGALARFRDIARDPRVTLLADRYDDDWTKLAWVRVEGTAEGMPRGEAWPEAVAALRARYRQYAAMALEETALMVITPVRVTSWHWGKPR
nr:TIGR03668 family PPOX class F420-dependent oxidoreductase [uncultured Candidatus Microthrix sp.]